MNIVELLKFIKDNSKGFEKCSNEQDTKTFVDKSKKYLYLIIWSEDDNIYSWGTMSGKSSRIRKSSIYNSKLTGKYDRRVDYLMLKILYGSPTVYLFETEEEPTKIENEIKNINGTKFCYYGLKGQDRVEISKQIFDDFKLTAHYCSTSVSDKNLFDEFFEEVFLGKRHHPKNPKRTFYFGDCLEPNFLRVIEKSHLEGAIELMLNVRF